MTDRSKECEALNLDAYLALQGFREQPQKHLQALLESDCEIDPMVRQALADAFGPSPPKGGLTFKIEGLGKQPTADFLKDKKRFDRLAIGRQVEALKQTGLKEKEAIRSVAKQNVLGKALSEKDVAGCATFARKADSWIAEKRSEEPSLHPIVLAGIFCRADHLNCDPSDLLSVQLERLKQHEPEWRAYCEERRSESS